MSDPTPEAETGGELRELDKILPPLIFGSDYRNLNADHTRKYDEVMGLIAAHTRRAVLLGKLEEQYRTGTGRLITGETGIVYFNEDGSTYKSQEERIKALEAELKEIDG